MAMVTGAFAYLSFLANKKLPDLLGEKVEIENLEISIIGNNVRFKAPKFRIDSTMNDANVGIQSQARSIFIEGFSFWDLLVSNEIGVDKLTIDSVAIHVELPKDRPYTSSQKEIHFFVTEIFTSISVKQFELSDANILVTKRGTFPDTLLEVSGFHLTAEGVLVDTATVNDIFPLTFEDSAIQMDSFKIKAGEQYVFSGKDLMIEDTTLTLSDLKLESIYTKGDFASHQDYEKARIDLMVTRLISRDLLWDFENDRFKIYSSKSTLEQAELLVYKDKRSLDQPMIKKPLLSELILDLPFILIIDTITIKESYIEYEEFPVLFPRSGKIFFDRMYVSAYNVTNDSARLKDTPLLTINVETDFMGKGDLTTNILLDLNSPTQAFKVNGTLGELPVTYINQVMTPLVGVTAEGTIHELDFEFSGDDYGANGNIKCEYSSLKVTMYDDQKNKELVKSIFGNMVLRNNNRKEDIINYKEGKIYFIRYQNKDFFDFLWNSIRVGLMDIVIPFYSNPDLQNPPHNAKFKKD